MLTSRFLSLAAFALLGGAVSSALAAPVDSSTTGVPGTFSVSSTDLINQGQATFGASSFVGTDLYGDGVGNLNNGLVYTVNSGDTHGSLTPAQGGVATFTLNTSVNTQGYDITSITTLAGGQSGNWGNQKYTVAYTTVSNATFTDLTTVSYGDAAERQVVIVNDSAGPLATGVNALRFTFNGADVEVFREFDVVGTATGGTAVPEPASMGLLALGGLAALRRRRSA
jgi:hypothetical protein